ncbi:MAG: branched-chain amino acid ABC transporter permease [Rhizobiales bacterium PAR1]|nr:MAG: branched-chain amino acid ABC transporter permease [Rhizobiales bacterium PAR1]
MNRSLTQPTNLALGLVLILLIALPFFAPNYYVQFASKAMLMGMLALSLNLVVGFGGLVSLCHAAFFGLAGYMLGFQSPESAGASLWLSLPVALLVVAAVAAVIGTLSLRTRGIYFIMVTLAFGEMLFYFFHDTKIGGGSDGLYIYFKPEIALFGQTLIDLDNSRSFYLLVLASLVMTAGLIRGLVNSPFGHALQAARDNERRALSLGFPVFRLRLMAFILSAMIAGLAGYFSAAQFGFVAPQMLGWHLSATVLVMVVLGGMSSILGPIVGAFALIGLEEVLKSAFEHWKLIKGLIIIALVFALPGGLQQLTRLVLPKSEGPHTGKDSDNQPVEADHAANLGSLSDPMTGLIQPPMTSANAKGLQHV